MAAKPSLLHSFRQNPSRWRWLAAAALVLAVASGGAVYAANNSVQGAKKDDNAFDGDAPTAILIEAASGSILFEKNADELRAPSSMMKLMTVAVVFNAIREGKVKLTDEYRISENAWRRGGRHWSCCRKSRCRPNSWTGSRRGSARGPANGTAASPAPNAAGCGTWPGAARSGWSWARVRRCSCPLPIWA